ncbi:tyrosine-type recombinase/integrase [Desulfovibrio sp. TomC]|uniref:tyrosine-type recombinase/integrase n=1 Tax=Desulfovibrio sp. TomC TaxID=1562888 RepID=UPI00057352EC|nr:integrase arm-type DNA-binding domain-containing protein [Desulfovibrio sp. TomC]KHK02354.1 Integrase [Desulfovibrio sp. TomC]
MLTDTAVRNAKPGAKAVKLFDGGGLYLEVAPSGGKWWRLKYRHGGKEKRISLGVYPAVGLKDARTRRDEARKLIANGVDPSKARQEEKAEAAAEALTFEHVAREWYERFKPKWSASHSLDVIQRLEKNVFASLGPRPIRDITAPELLAAVRLIEGRGAVESARRILQMCGQIFRYAIATGQADRDIAADLRGSLPPAREKHHASLTDPKAVAQLLRAIDGYEGSMVARCALRLAPLVFVRPGELRHAEWSEIDLDKAEWRIPAAKMKMKEQHIVPLSRQAVAILLELHPLTGAGKYVFPSVRTSARPMSENTVLAALRRMGYTKDEMTGHGFRSMASTLLNEMGWNRDAIERQLAHAERNAVRAAYNFAEHLPERRKMMQAWADYLEKLKAGAKVTPLHAAAGE